jgi:hypothetical protein
MGNDFERNKQFGFEEIFDDVATQNTSAHTRDNNILDLTIVIRDCETFCLSQSIGDLVSKSLDTPQEIAMIEFFD